MFDDPKLRLEELEQALKAAEAEDELDWLMDTKSLIGEEDLEDDSLDWEDEASQEEKPLRPSWSKQTPKEPESVRIPWTKFADEEMEDSDALFVEPPKKKGAGSLVVLAVLELIAIVLILLWWVKWTL